MIAEARLPPLFRLTALPGDADVAAEACASAEAGADPGTVLCADRTDRFLCSVVLHPDRDAAAARLGLYVGMLGLGDAIGSVVPAGLDITFAWPNRIVSNTGLVAAVTVDLPETGGGDEIPAWMTVNADLFVGLHGPERAVPVSVTSLAEEGCVEVTVRDLLESFSRHFLTWANRWNDDGFDPVRAMWLRHSDDLGSDVDVSLGDVVIAGALGGIDDDGALLLDIDGDRRRVELAGAARPLDEIVDAMSASTR
jgi:BirA family biotin operon repressor/biotin-[acetyl-CoA-carboxylase] ligase